MGGKTTVTKTELPEPTPEENRMSALFSAILDSQMTMNYDKIENKKFVYTKQAEIDQATKELNDLVAGNNPATASKVGLPRDSQSATGAGPIPNQKRINELTNMIDNLKKEGGKEEISYTFNEKPEVKARRLHNEAEGDKINDLFFKNATKVMNGDFSITPEQKAQIKQLTADNFDPIMDILKTEYSSAEDAVNKAVERLVESGKVNIVQQLADERNKQKENANLLGRSFNDMSFQREFGKLSADAYERLFSEGAATAAGGIAQLRGQRAAAMGGVAEQKGLAGYNLSLQAANPLSAFTSGAQFAQLQGALNAQNIANQNINTGNALGRLGQLGNLRAAAPTTSVTQPYGPLSYIRDITNTMVDQFSKVAGAFMPG